MTSFKAETELNPEEGLRLFTLGELVVGQEMVARLDDAGFYIQEHELLDAGSWPRRSGLPVVKVNGVPGLFFSPPEVIAFMNAWVDSAGTQPQDEIPRVSGGDFG